MNPLVSSKSIVTCRRLVRRRLGFVLRAALIGLCQKHAEVVDLAAQSVIEKRQTYLSI